MATPNSILLKIKEFCERKIKNLESLAVVWDEDEDGDYNLGAINAYKNIIDIIEGRDNIK